MTTETQTALATFSEPVDRPVNLMQTSPFTTREAFQLATDMAVQLSRSSIIPDAYRDMYLKGTEWKQNEDAAGNCFIVLELANRLRVSPLVVMQQVDVIYGRPSLRGTFMVALINNAKEFTDLTFVCTHAAEIGALERQMQDIADQLETAVGDSVQGLIEKSAALRKQIAAIRKADDYGYYCVATRFSDNRVCRGATIDWALVKAEGWDAKKDSKWKSIPEQMFIYRAASFWGRQYGSHITLGLHETDELRDALEGEFERIPATSARTRALESALGSAEAAQDGAPKDATPAKDAEQPAGKPRARRRHAADAPAPEKAETETGAEPDTAGADDHAQPAEASPAKTEHAPRPETPEDGSDFSLE